MRLGLDNCAETCWGSPLTPARRRLVRPQSSAGLTGPDTLSPVSIFLAPARAPRRNRPMTAAVFAGAAALTVSLSGCGLNSPVQTDHDYPAADGIGLSLGQVHLRNLAVVASGKDGPGTLIGQAVNRSSGSVTLRIGVEGGAPVTIEVPGRGDATISTAEKKTSLAAVPGQPGDWVKVVVAGAPGGDGSVTIPILSAEDYLKDFAPTS